MIIFLIFPLIFGLTGILLLYFHLKIRKNRRKCTSQTAGRVVRVNSGTSGRSSNATRATYYYPVFQYYVNGTEYTLTASTGSGSPKLFPVGKTVTVYYDPASPDKSYVKEKSVLLIAGIVFVACAVIFAFLPLFLLKFAGAIPLTFTS